MAMERGFPGDLIVMLMRDIEEATEELAGSAGGVFQAGDRVRD